MGDTQKSSTYFNLIDFGRFFAAMSVVSFHYFSQTAKSLETGVVKFFVEYGFMGVQLFFMISGFVIFFSLQGSPKKYALSRFLRIYPLFWFCCTLTYVTTIFFGESHVPVSTYLRNLLVINDGKTAGLVDGSYWTLTHEIFFYTYAGIFAYLFGKKRLEYFFYIWLSILTIGVFLGLYSTFLFKVMLVRSGFYFIFGALLALLYTTKKSEISSAKTILRVVMLLVAAYMPVYLSGLIQSSNEVSTNNFGVYDHAGYVILILLYTLMAAMVFFSKYVTNATFVKTSVILGGMTYPLYLLHQTIGYTVLRMVGTWGYASIATAIFVGGLLAVVYVIYYYEDILRKKMYTALVRRLSL